MFANLYLLYIKTFVFKAAASGELERVSALFWPFEVEPFESTLFLKALYEVQICLPGAT